MIGSMETGRPKYGANKTPEPENNKLSMVGALLMFLAIVACSIFLAYNYTVQIKIEQSGIKPGQIWKEKIERTIPYTDTSVIVTCRNEVYDVDQDNVYYIQDGVDTMEADHETFKTNSYRVK
jgi:hypothetical protein